MSGGESPGGGARLTRRAVLLGAAGGVGALLVGGQVLTSCGGGDDADGDEHPSSASTTQPTIEPSPERVAEIVALGARYRELAPQDTTADALAADLPGPSQHLEQPAAVEGLLEAHRDAIRAEYRHGQVVTIDGWRIARTEAQLAALASLRAN